MLRSFVRRAAVVAAASTTLTVTAVALPTTAHAQTGNLATTSSVVAAATPNPNDGLDGAFGGSPATVLQNILCPVVSTVTGVTTNIPGVGPLLDELPGIVCAIGVAGYVYRTTYYSTSGAPVVKYHRALIGVPALIDVDGKGLPDFTGLVALALPGLSLQLSRSLLFPASERVKIEAVAIVPGSPNTFIGFGEDGSKVGTAKHWKAALTVAGLSSEGAELKLALDTTSAPSSLGVVGEMFSGPDPDAPDNTFRGTAGFSPVPDSFTTRIVATKGQQEVHAQGTPTTLTADIDILSGNRAQNVHAVADKLPASVDVVHSAVGGADSTTYDANAAVAKITGSYRDTVDGEVQTAAALDAWGVSRHVSLVQSGDRTTLDAGAGKIDQAQARFASGSDVDTLAPGTAPFARFHRTTADDFTAGLQVSDFRSVSIDQGTPISGRLTFATAPGLFPITADDDVTSTHLEGSLTNLPLDTTVTADLDNGAVTFDGHGTGIDQIALTATRPTPFFTRATRLEATLSDLPALETIDIGQDAGALTATASQPLGRITLLADDNTTDVDPTPFDGPGASYVDTPGRYRAFLRMDGLKSVSFQGNPVVGDLQTSRSQPFTVAGNVGGVTFNGAISNLPAHMTFAMRPGADGSSVVDFDSHGEAVSTITATGDGLITPLALPNFETTIEDLPSHLTVTLPAGDGNVVFDAHGDHVGRVFAQAWAGTAKASIPANQQKLEFIAGQHVAANLLHIGNAEISTTTSPFRLKYDIAAQPLAFEGQALGNLLRGSIENPQPATVTFQPFDKDTDGEGGVKVKYNVDPLNHTGDGSILRISLTAVFGKASINATVTHVPANLDICLQTDDGGLCRPVWVPRNSLGRIVVAPSFAVRFLPTDLDGKVPAVPVVVDGQVCTDISNAFDCSRAGQRDKHIVIDELSFKTFEAAFGSHDEGCTVACGNVWAAANTHGAGSPIEGDHITGQVRYFDGGDNGGEPLVDLDLKPTSAFVAMNELFLFLHYDATSIEPLSTTSTGTLTCGDDPNLTIGLNNLPDPDLLSGTLGIC